MAVKYLIDAVRQIRSFSLEYDGVRLEVISSRKGVAMKVRPLADRVLVKRVRETEKTKGGIIIPDTAKEKPQEGKVVATGKGKIVHDGKLIPPEVKPGDTILFSKYAGNDIVIDAEEHLVLREEEILGVVEG